MEDKEILERFKDFGTKYGIELPTQTEKLDKELFEYVKSVFKKVQYLNKPSLSLQIKRQRIRDYIDDLDRCYAKADSCESDGAGFNNGYRPNMEENRQIEKIKLREKLKDLLAENLIHDKQVDSVNQMASNVIDLVPNAVQRDIMKSFYIHQLNNRDISEGICYSNQVVFEYRQRGLRAVAKLVKISFFDKNL